MSDPWGAPEGERRPDSPQPPSPPPVYGQASAGGPPPPGQPPYGQPPPGQPAYAGGYGSPPAAVETDQNAILALVFAVLAWVVCPVILAIVALILAHNADQSIAASGGTKGGAGLVKAARIVSWLNIGLVIGGIVLAVLAIVLFAGTA